VNNTSRLSVPELVAAMLAGDVAAAADFVQRQPVQSLPTLIDGAQCLSAVLHVLQLRDTDAFLRAKYPDPLPVIDGAVFRSALDAAINGEGEQAQAILAPLPLPTLFAVSSLAHRLRLAGIARLHDGPADRLLEPRSPADDQHHHG